MLSPLPLRFRRRHQWRGDLFAEGEAEPLGAARRNTAKRGAKGRAARERASAKVFDAVAVAGELVGPVTAIHGAVEFSMHFQQRSRHHQRVVDIGQGRTRVACQRESRYNR